MLKYISLRLGTCTGIMKALSRTGYKGFRSSCDCGSVKSSSEAAIRKVMTTLDRVHPLIWSMQCTDNGRHVSAGITQQTPKQKLVTQFGLAHPKPAGKSSDTSNGSRPSSTPPNIIDSNVDIQSSVTGKPSSGGQNLMNKMPKISKDMKRVTSKYIY